MLILSFLLLLIDFLKELMYNGVSYSMETDDRLFRSHGHTLDDLVGLRCGTIARLPDLVVWPGESTQNMGQRKNTELKN
jgi:hypothetical protein